MRATAKKQHTIARVQVSPSVLRPLARKPSALSPRQREVATLVSEGMLNKEIASKLGLSQSTVASYLRQMFLKFGVDRRAALVRVFLTESLRESR